MFQNIFPGGILTMVTNMGINFIKYIDIFKGVGVVLICFDKVSRRLPFTTGTTIISDPIDKWATFRDHFNPCLY